MIIRVIVSSNTSPDNTNVVWLDTKDQNNAILKHYYNGEWQAIAHINTEQFVTKSDLEEIIIPLVKEAINEAIVGLEISYNSLVDIPTLNSKKLQGDMTLEYLGIQPSGQYLNTSHNGDEQAHPNIQDNLNYKIDQTVGNILTILRTI